MVMEHAEALAWLYKRLRKTKSNAEFLERIATFVK
jgi:transcription termination factor Rho